MLFGSNQTLQMLAIGGVLALGVIYYLNHRKGRA